MARVKMRTPVMEIEIEGEEDFLLNRGQQLLLQLRQYEREFGTSKASIPAGLPETLAPMQGAHRTSREGTVNTLVAKMGGSSCRQVLLAAAAHLTLYQGQDRFTDDDWEATARTANSWKAKWTNQKATQKKRLVDSGTVIENSQGVYSLSSTTIAALESKLAQ